MWNVPVQHIHLPQPARVAIELMTPYLGRGHHLHTDRYYTSVQLAQALHTNNTAFTGVTNKNRTELPDNIRKITKMKGGVVRAHRSGELLALAWQAEKRKVPVIMLSSEASAKMDMVQSSNTFVRPFLKPSVVDSYNHNMKSTKVLNPRR